MDGGLLRRSEALVANPLFAYGAVLLLQLRVIWNIWRHRDLTFGDTSGYFMRAADWAHGLRDDIVWSPLYTSFWGTILAAVQDVYAAAMIHRVAIVLATSVLVLALMRALLHPGLALLLAVWWVVLPPNFDVLYEVHLFGVLPVLVAALILARSQARAARGVAFGVLLGATLLLRNELAITTAVVGIAVVVKELRERRSRSARKPGTARAYGVPVAVVILLTAGAYWRSDVQGDRVLDSLRLKHTLNVCQAYAFNYQQRHPTKFEGSPWIDCQPLMRRTFGASMPNFREAMAANPGAMADYVGWNARLLPSGLQVSLFGATVTHAEPDYVPVDKGRTYPLILSVLLLATVVVGLTVMVRDWRYWRRVLAPRALGIVVLAAAGLTTLVVALTQRPRPEYMYALVVGVMALTGYCVSAITRRWGRDSLLAPLAAGLVVVLCLAMPTYYDPGPRPLRDGIERLHVVQGALQRPGSVLITAADGQSLCHYLADRSAGHCISPSWGVLKEQLVRGRAVEDVLDNARATVVYADPAMHGDPQLTPLLSSPRAHGWSKISEGEGGDGRWSILLRDR